MYTCARTPPHTHNTCTHVPTDIPHNHRQLHTHTTYLSVHTPHMCTHMYVCTLSNVGTQVHTLTCMRTHSQTCTLMCTHTHAHTHTCAHSDVHTCPQSHRCTHACTLSPQTRGCRVGPLCSCCMADAEPGTPSRPRNEGRGTAWHVQRHSLILSGISCECPQMHTCSAEETASCWWLSCW